MSVLSLDFGVLLGGFCIADISFYQRLLSSTLILLGAVGMIILRSRSTSMRAAAKGSRAKQGVFVAIYLLLFLYPVLSVKIVEAFACHEVEGVRYLRADYSVRCDSREWKAMAAYAGVWMLVYVIAFPLFVLCKLWSYRGSTTAEQQVTNTPELVDLRFLLHDYKSVAPVLMWEVRKQVFLATL
jgi:nitrate reductase NapE component